MPRAVVGVALAACVAAGCGLPEEPAGHSRATDRTSAGSRPVEYKPVAAPLIDTHATTAEATPSRAIEVTEADFDRVVLMSGLPVLVDFRAAWCGNCQTLEPTIEELAREFDGKVFVVKVDYDRSPALVERYQVRKLPALLMFVDGRVVEETRGVKPKDELAGMVSSHLNPAPVTINAGTPGTPVESTPERTASAAVEPTPAPPMPTASAGSSLALPPEKGAAP